MLRAVVDGVRITVRGDGRTIPVLRGIFPLIRVPELDRVPLSKGRIKSRRCGTRLGRLRTGLKDLRGHLCQGEIPIVVACRN